MISRLVYHCLKGFDGFGSNGSCITCAIAPSSRSLPSLTSISTYTSGTNTFRFSAPPPRPPAQRAAPPPPAEDPSPYGEDGDDDYGDIDSEWGNPLRHHVYIND